MPVNAAPLEPPVRPVAVVARFRAAPRYVAGGRASVRLHVNAGATVRAPCAGRLSFVGRVAGGPSLVTLACADAARLRVTLSGLSPRAGVVRGASLATTDAIGRTTTAQLGLSVRDAGRYVDPIPLLRVGGAVPPVVPLQPRARLPRWTPPTVRLDRPVRVAERAAAAPVAAPSAGADRLLGAVGVALGGVAAVAALRRRRIRVTVPADEHPVAALRQ